jgi:hypothetical protein
MSIDNALASVAGSGHWQVFETQASAAGTLSATDTHRWLPGMQFIVHDVDARSDDKLAQARTSPHKPAQAGTSAHGPWR